MLEGEIRPHYPEGKKKNKKKKNWEWALQVDYVFQSAEWLWECDLGCLKKSEGISAIWIVPGLLTMAMGKQSLNVAEKPS